jgi:hypothetical protein
MRDLGTTDEERQSGVRDDRPANVCGFPTTHWSLVGRAADPAALDSERRDALARVLASYLGPLRYYLGSVRRLGDDRAEDLLQSFLADKVLARDLLSRAAADRGRFRSFLVAALDNFVSNEFRAAAAAKRAPRGRVPFDAAVHADAHAAEDPDGFDLRWAREVLAQALEAMRAECRAGGRDDLWRVFDARVVRPTLHGEDPLPYPALVAELGFASPAQASNALVTANRMFARVLRAVVGAYELGDVDVDAEIRDLWRILADRARRAGRGGG